MIKESMEILENLDLSNKNVLVRLDLDVPIQEGNVVDDTRLVEGVKTLRFLTERDARITVIGHLGRPKGREVAELRIEPVHTWIQERFPKVSVLENLRFDPGEAQNSLPYAEDIVRRSQAQSYVFDAFAVSHREHASVVGIPKLLPTAMGFRMRNELVVLGKVLQTPKRPFVVIVGGAKPETKLPLVGKLATTADAILIGGTLPFALDAFDDLVDNSKVHVAGLTSDKLDISQESAQEFSRMIMEAGTVVWNGPVGAFERSDKRQVTSDKSDNTFRNTPAWGTYAIAKAVSSTPAYTVVGGGDTEAALTRFGLESGIDWISSGGGAMLHYLAYRTLPFLEAVDK